MIEKIFLQVFQLGADINESIKFDGRHPSILLRMKSQGDQFLHVSYGFGRKNLDFVVVHVSAKLIEQSKSLNHCNYWCSLSIRHLQLKSANLF